MLVIALLIQSVCAMVPAAEVRAIVEFGVTVMVPLAVACTHGPVVVTV